MRNSIVKASKSKPVVKPFNVGDIVAICERIGIDSGGVVIASDPNLTTWTTADGKVDCQSTDEVYLVARANSQPLARVGHEVSCWIRGELHTGKIVEVTELGAVIKPVANENSTSPIDAMDYPLLFITHADLLIFSDQSADDESAK